MNMFIHDNLQTIGARIRTAERHYGRVPGSVQLVAVSKRHSAAAIRAAYAAGQRAFGENYAQEMLAKAMELNDCAIEWHFIGPLQSNKAKVVAQTARWVHTVASLKVAELLSRHKPPASPELNICLQVNISGEASKSGLALAELPDLASQVAQLPGLRLRGLMAIPAPEPDFNKQRAVFAELRQALEALQAWGLALDTLSMGMSDDMEAAIAEGATLVRIGTAIFGTRK